MKGKTQGIERKRLRIEIWAVLMAITLIMSGCHMQIASYRSKGIVEPDTRVVMSETGQLAQAAFPWQAVADFLAEVLPTLGQTRRKAIDEKVGYTEEREFTLFEVTK